jgi:CRISPR-associated protein Cas2
MLIVISYDIADNSRLLKAAKEVENFGSRVQKSVFECYLEEEQLSEIRRILADIIDKETDHVRYYRICRKDEEKVILLGNAVVCGDYDYFVV